MRLRRYILSNDTFVRHRCISLLAAEYRVGTIADVGGEGALRHFFGPGVTIQSVNTREGEAVTVKYAGTRLPFDEGSFDLAVSLDTLEHIPKPERVGFCRELLRISRKAMILCAPLGTEAHIEHEKRLYAMEGMDLDSRKYLEQHIGLGLPTLEEVHMLVGNLGGKIYYQGDFRKPALQRMPGKNRYLLSIYNVTMNLYTETARPLFCWLQQAPHAHTNRFFLVAEK